MTDKPIYEDRLLLYADILGWRGAVGSRDPETLLEVVRELHEPAKAHNERARIELEEQRVVKTDIGTFPVTWINPLYQQVQFGAFSDNFVYSVPADFGGRILSTASGLIVSLLRKGLLTRGAIVLGKLYHVDNVIFGPALNEAVKIEQQEAFYPRILISSHAEEHIAQQTSSPGDEPMISDHTGRRVVNPFALGFDRPEELVASAIRSNFHPLEIDNVVAREIADLTNHGRHKEAEKWEYMARLIDGPILNSHPKLRKAWRS